MIPIRTGSPSGRAEGAPVARCDPASLAAALKYWTVAFPPEPFWIMRLVSRTDGGGQRS